MSRLVPYRTKAPPPVAERMEQILSMTMYLVQTTGPTSYVIQEQNCEKKHKVLIGSLQSCSCGELDVCLHVLFVMLKVLRVPATNPIVWQKSLIDSEIEMLLRGDYREQNAAAPRPVNSFVKRRKGAPSVPQSEPETADVKRHELIEGEVCAICQEEMDNIQPLTFCRKGCGSNFHVECMKVFGESRRQSKENITCPLCRHDWGDLALTALRKESEVANRAPNVHKSVSCKKCQTKPIRNERYRCIQCKHTDLCSRCFQSNAHEKHAFVMKKNVKDAWSPGLRPNQIRPGITTDMISELENRELSTNDYDVLLQLDQREKYPLHEYLLSVLPGQKISSADAKTFGALGDQCSICSTSLRIQADIRSIPCGHAFHESCLSRSILSQVYRCPFSGCEFTIFPGLYQLALKKGSKDEKKQESKPDFNVACQEVLPVLGSAMRGVSVQQRDILVPQSKSSSRSNARSRGTQHTTVEESEKLPAMFGLVSIGLSCPASRPDSNHHSSRATRSLARKAGQNFTNQHSNQMESDRTERESVVHKITQVSTTGVSTKYNRPNNVAKLPTLATRRATPEYSPDESALIQRLGQAGKNRADLKHLDKVRLQNLREQREERTRAHHMNANKPLPELNGLVASMASVSSTLDGRLEKAQLMRTNAQIQMKQDLIKTRQAREGNQRLHLLQHQQHEQLTNLFIGK